MPVQKVPQIVRRTGLARRRRLAPLPAHLVLVLLHLGIRIDRLADDQLEVVIPPVFPLDLGLIEDLKVLHRVPVVRRVVGPALVPRLPEARLPEEDDSIFIQPCKHVLRQLFHLGVGQIHQQPVGEDHVGRGRRQRQLRRVATSEVDIAQVTVRNLVLIDEILHEVERDDRRGLWSNLGREPTDPGAQLHHATVLRRTQQRDDLCVRNAIVVVSDSAQAMRARAAA